LEPSIPWKQACILVTPTTLAPPPKKTKTTQVLFIDNDDVLRGRLAAALFERVAEWNGHGRVLCAWTCGVEADQGARAGDLSTAAALMFKARALGLRPKAFARPTERFEAADLDRCAARDAAPRARLVVGDQVCFVVVVYTHVTPPSFSSTPLPPPLPPKNNNPQPRRDRGRRRRH
jgi:hypothetical protein